MLRFCKISLLLSLFLSLNVAADGRTTISLSQSERDFVLMEMRAFLSSVQQIVSGVSENNMQQVVQAAHHVGMHTAHQAPASLKGKLPMEFKKLGADTHKRFDQMAVNAKDFGEKELVLEQLAELMKNCVSCHATFRFELETAK